MSEREFDGEAIVERIGFVRERRSSRSFVMPAKGFMVMGFCVENTICSAFRSLPIFSKLRPTSITKTEPPVLRLERASSCMKTDFPDPIRPTTQIL